MRKLAFLAIAMGTAIAPIFGESSLDFSKDFDPLMIPQSKLHIIDIKELTVTELEGFTKGMNGEGSQEEIMESLAKNVPTDLVIEIPPGTLFPISITSSGDLISLVEGNPEIGKIKINQKIFARLIKGNLFLSSDLICWKPFSEFITGKVNAGLKIEDGKQMIFFSSEISQRKE